MKFRTDFVTNSSSSFLAFNVKNEVLVDSLSNLGIRFERTPNGVFSDQMSIVLPSGESTVIECENSSLTTLDECTSISVWIISLLLWEIGIYQENDDFSDFDKELISLLNEAGITHLEWTDIEKWDRDIVIEKELSPRFDPMDGYIEKATIEHTKGWEGGEVGPCIYTEVNNGQRISINYPNDTYRDLVNNAEYAIAGNLKHFKIKRILLMRSKI